MLEDLNIKKIIDINYHISLEDEDGKYIDPNWIYADLLKEKGEDIFYITDNNDISHSVPTSAWAVEYDTMRWLYLNSSRITFLNKVIKNFNIGKTEKVMTFLESYFQHFYHGELADAIFKTAEEVTISREYKIENGRFVPIHYEDVYLYEDDDYPRVGITLEVGKNLNVSFLITPPLPEEVFDDIDNIHVRSNDYQTSINFEVDGKKNRNTFVKIIKRIKESL